MQLHDPSTLLRQLKAFGPWLYLPHITPGSHNHWVMDY